MNQTQKQQLHATATQFLIKEVDIKWLQLIPVYDINLSVMYGNYKRYVEQQLDVAMPQIWFNRVVRVHCKAVDIKTAPLPLHHPQQP